MKQNWDYKTAIYEIDVDKPLPAFKNLKGYQEVLVVFRWQGSVVGQGRISVKQDRVDPDKLRECLKETAWPIWQKIMNNHQNLPKILPTATVVVCSHDRTEDLRECIPGLLRLKEKGHEVIVVDSGPSTDSTANLMAQYSEIRYIHEPRPGLDIARNRGLKAAQGEIVAFTDDDAKVDDGWLTALLCNFDDPTVAIVTGITLPSELETKAQQWFESTNGFGRGYVRKQFDMTTMNPIASGRVGAGVNMAIRRSALEYIGLFDEALDCGTVTRSGGDQEFFYRTLIRGYRIVYEPGALVWHRHRRDWESLRNTMHGYGVGVYSWWLRAVIEERDFSLFLNALSWFWKWHVRNLICSLLGRPDSFPLDLAIAEFRGALAGPLSYLKSRRIQNKQTA